MSSDEKFFYANGAEMAMSVYDITFKFLRNGSVSSNVGSVPAAAGTMQVGVGSTVLDSMAVSMSPSHAKMIAIGLLGLLDAYEQNHGPIPLESDAKSKWNEQVAKASSKV